jgi:hypothetical protein
MARLSCCAYEHLGAGDYSALGFPSLGSLVVMADTGEAVGDLHLATVVINVQNMRRAVDFWTAVLGYARREQEWDPEFMMLVDPARRRLPVSLQLAEFPPKEPVRIHVDLYTRERARHVQRLVELGATRVEDCPTPTTRILSFCGTQTATSFA